MGKHSKRKNINWKRILLVVQAIALIVIITIVVNIKVSENNDDKEQERISKVLETIDIDEEKITDKITKRMQQVEELQKNNPEVIGWIEIEGTKINYPVCQTSDNEYYLTHTYKKEENSNGSIFLDKDYDFSIPSENLLIYRT